MSARIHGVRIIGKRRVVAWIGAEMEFALSQPVPSGGAFEHRPSECGHCIQDFLTDLNLRDLPGEAAGFELGADHALPTADLRAFALCFSGMVTLKVWVLTSRPGQQHIAA